ncbi:lysylphosphatidylglycerol synthase transmembrane domain-containing protein [Nocardia seriolae]|uniref:lysylphosphatidylglycerol synthase transmembrane domain-containing protein n=1 Tax=Nocardia seriolae TaxID=37332 RepID=UPI00051A3372|nr:lysylphosphatidylglycerol synthase transmembrane domain-containing protein [Nocardia seriolae]MTJ66920.1 flippase-like domain-containing protein [Nocardia seriolae]MTJ74261.1 flippase-like domain-containing protein [Nocardia seriolae]MTJ84902.1 flippase-like domain-containing protein [Nocardia seriolae]MTK28898.1 flippase-like domain-containing protein [Nocardia seriolae]MTK44914.1 flippase-like domain-containing protein [Nocardia seriolae]
MRVDGREIPVSGSLLQPRIRRTSDILRVVLSALSVAIVIAGSLITRPQWEQLERSVSGIVGFLTPEQSNLVYIVYGIAILALPFAILVRLVLRGQWKLLAGFLSAGLIALGLFSITGTGFSAPRWHLSEPQQVNTFLSQFLDDPRWIAMLAAVLTVASPWLPKRWRRWWWTLLLAFVPIHLFVSLVVPARAALGLVVGWLVGSVIVLVVGTPALEVPLDAVVRVLARRGFRVTAFKVVRPAARGPLVLSASTVPQPGLSASPNGGAAPKPTGATAGANGSPDNELIIEMYGANQRSRGMLQQFRRWLTIRSGEYPASFASMRRAVEHRALMGFAIADLGLASNKPLTVAALDRSWMMYAHTVAQGRPLTAADGEKTLTRVWQALHSMHQAQISHGDLRTDEIRVLDDDTVLFEGFVQSEFGAYKVRFDSDVAQLLLSSSALFGTEPAVRTALEVLDKQAVLDASARLTRTAMPAHLRKAVPEAGDLMKELRTEVVEQTGQDKIAAAQVTRFSRNQIIQLVLLIGLVYVAYPYISQVPTFFTELHNLHWGWALLGLTVSALTYVGAAMALWACASEAVKFRNLLLMQIANTFAATTTPAGVGGLALSVRFLQKGGLGAVRATAAVALQQTVQVVTHVILLMIFGALAGTSTNLSHFVPSATVLYFVAGALLGLLGATMFIPKIRRWLLDEVRPQLAEVVGQLKDLGRKPGRMAMIIGGCATTTLGMALALWASIEAFGGNTTFVTVTIVTMIGGTLASAAPTPGGVGAVEAALIGGLAAFGVSAAIAVPAVLLYRVLTCWLPVFCGWPIMRWLTAKDMI